MSTNRYVIDSWAWIEYFLGTEAGLKVEKLIESGEAITNSVTISEVISKFKRDNQDINEPFNAIGSISRIVGVDHIFAFETGKLHAEIKKKRRNFSLADSFALYTAKSLNAKVVTGDPDFKGLKEAVLIKS